MPVRGTVLGMVGTDVLTTDDLDEIGTTALRGGGDPRHVSARLVEAVDQDRLADPADAGYALCLAGELSADVDDLEGAVALVDRAIESNSRLGDGLDDGYPHALRAELLHRLDRDDEAVAELTGLRPRLLQEQEAAYYLTEALEATGRTELAEQWLTEALDLAVPQLDAAEESPEQDVAGPVRVFNALLQSRHRVRRELDLPHDAHDDLADQLQEMHQATHDVEVLAEVFWPRAEFDRLMARWPQLAETQGHSWDEHRAVVESELAAAATQGAVRLMVIAATVDEYADLVAALDADVTDPSLLDSYIERVEHDEARFLPWPPGRNDACWCGSGTKYKKCCLPRSRG